MTADDHLRLVARAARTTDPRLGDARRAAREAIGTGRPGHSLLHRLLRELFDWLGNLVPGVSFGGSVAGVLGYVVLAAVAVGLAILAFNLKA
jgi:hypothetical protein